MNNYMMPQGGYQPQQQIIDGGLYYASSSQEVYQYHVAPGYRVEFVVRPERKYYIKTCFSSFQPPSVEEYDIVPHVPPQQERPEDQYEKRFAAIEEALKKLTGGASDAAE